QANEATQSKNKFQRPQSEIRGIHSEQHTINWMDAILRNEETRTKRYLQKWTRNHSPCALADAIDATAIRIVQGSGAPHPKFGSGPAPAAPPGCPCLSSPILLCCRYQISKPAMATNIRMTKLSTISSSFP